MSVTLDRFRIKGGFQQLVQIVETTEPVKRKNILHLVSVEDPGWAHLLKMKTLNLDRIFSWPREVLQEVLPTVSDAVLVVIYQSLVDTQKPKLVLSVPQKRMDRVLQDAKTQVPTPHESFAATVQLIQAVRALESQKIIDFSHFDPSLVIDEQIAS